VVNDAGMRVGNRINGRAHPLDRGVSTHGDSLTWNWVIAAVAAQSPPRWELVAEAVAFLGEESEGEGVIQ
jgi:hypothetical protein